MQRRRWLPVLMQRWSRRRNGLGARLLLLPASARQAVSPTSKSLDTLKRQSRAAARVSAPRYLNLNCKTPDAALGPDSEIGLGSL